MVHKIDRKNKIGKLNKDFERYFSDVLSNEVVLANEVKKFVENQIEINKEIVNLIREICKAFDKLLESLKKILQNIFTTITITFLIVFFKNEIINIFAQIILVIYSYFNFGIKMFSRLSIDEKFRYLYYFPLTVLFGVIIGRKFRK